MRTTLQIATQPVIEPVTVQQIQRHLRIDSDDDLDVVTGLGKAARVMAEAYLSRALITTSYLWTMAPSGDARRRPRQWHSEIELPRAPVRNVGSVVLTDIDGTATTLDPAAYTVDLALEPARVRLKYTAGLIPTSHPIQHFQVAFAAGYGDDAASVPAPIATAILVTTAFLYENRGDDGGALPQAAEWLLEPYRLHFFGG
jgi:uncharacterized phiE125 gp8 family phage protein